MATIVMSHSPKTIIFAITTALMLVLITRWRLKGEIQRRKKKKKTGSVNIGGLKMILLTECFPDASIMQQYLVWMSAER